MAGENRETENVLTANRGKRSWKLALAVELQESVWTDSNDNHGPSVSSSHHILLSPWRVSQFGGRLLKVQW